MCTANSNDATESTHNTLETHGMTSFAALITEKEQQVAVLRASTDKRHMLKSLVVIASFERLNQQLE